MNDPKIIDVLIAKERMEYQETMNCWKMNDQLLGGLIQGDGGKPVEGTFLQKFYQGELVVCSLFLSIPPPCLHPRRVIPFRVRFRVSILVFGVDQILIVCA